MMVVLLFVRPSAGLWKSDAHGVGGGTAFDDTALGGTLKSVEAGVENATVRRLSVSYARGNATHGVGGVAESLALEDGEFITLMVVGLSGRVVAIELATSRGRNASFGSGASSRVRLTAPSEALGLVAFHGTAADTLTSLGGYWELCAFCDAGSKATLVDGDCACEECPANTVAETAAFECAPCPEGFVSRPGSDTCFTSSSPLKRRAVGWTLSSWLSTPSLAWSSW